MRIEHIILGIITLTIVIANYKTWIELIEECKMCFKEGKR